MDNPYINLDTRFMHANKSTLKAMGIALDLHLSDCCSLRISGSEVSVTHSMRHTTRKDQTSYIGEYLIKAPGFWETKRLNHNLDATKARHAKAIKLMISKMECEYNIKVYMSHNRYGPDHPSAEYNVSLMVYKCLS